MTATVDIGVVPVLSDAQAIDILNLSLAAGFFETGSSGELPPNPDDRIKAASELVRQSRLSALAGSRNENVTAILFCAEVDLTSAVTTQPTQGATMSTAQQDNDLSKHPTALLAKLLESLAQFPEERADERDRNIALVRQEVLTRAGTGDQDAINLAATFGAAPAQTVAQAVAQAPPPQPAAPANGAVSRTDLENQLSFSIMRAHNIDPSQIDQLTDEQLAWVIAHPNPQPAAPAQEPQSPPVGADADSRTQMPEPTGDTIETTVMVANPPPAPPAPPAPTRTPSSDDVSPERLALEEQVTGEMLKFYGRGRVDVANGSIGDHELAFMLQHPDGKAAMEDLLAARARDQAGAPAQAPAPAEAPTIADQMRAAKAPELAPAPTPAAEAFAPPAATPEIPPTPAPAAVPMNVPASVPVDRPLLTSDLPANSAQEIIDREHFPIPAELEGDPPRLPYDLSKLTDEEIRSFHSMAHAWHSRALYVTGLWESELRDETKLRKGREIEVQNALPMNEGRSKLTESQREARVAADPEVLAHKHKEHQLEGIVRQLRLLSDNYGRDVSVCSRQLGRNDDERSGARA